MRAFALMFVALLVGCMTPSAPPTDAAVNQLSERYVRMTLEMDTHERGYVDAYYGAPEWKTEAEAHPRAIPALKQEADAIGVALALQGAQASDAMERRRIATLRGYVSSARARLDMMEGTRWKFADEAERILGLRPETRPLATYDAALARIEQIVPGQGALTDRVEAFRAYYAIPSDRLQRVMDAAIAECRRRTLAHIPLPANENFRMEFVTHQSWGAYNWFQGNAQSLIQVNTDFPVQIDRALGLGCHEGYPGHHVQGIYAEKLYKERGWAEFSVAPLFSPQGPLNEGGGNFGVDLAFPGNERVEYEARVLYPLAGLDPATAPAYAALRSATNDLSGARITIAQMYIDGEINRDRALELIQRYQLVSRARAEQSLAFTDHYRSYVINYANGEDLVRAYVTRVHGAEAQWARYKSILAEPTLPRDLQ